MRWRIGSRRYGAPIGGVREVIPLPRATRIPGAPPEVLGLVNVRGAIVTVLNGWALCREARTEQAELMVLLEVGGRVIGLAVDEVEDLMDTGEGEGIPSSVEVPDLEALIGPVFANPVAAQE